MNSIQILKDYIRCQSVSADPSYHQEVIKSKRFVCDLLKSIHFNIEIIETPLYPIILARRIHHPSNPHICLYAHYDVQPADPFELWESDPFEPVVKDNRIYGRGATDNKGPFVAQFCALANVLKENPNLPLNITFLIEGEEEIGSPSFDGFLDKYGNVLSSAEALFISDTTIPSPEQITVTSSLRGILSLEVTLQGPAIDLHSGLFGGPIMNPIRALAKLLSTLHDEDNRVDIPGFYEGVVEPEQWEREDLNQYPFDEKELTNITKVNHFVPTKGLSAIESIRFYPTLEFNGIQGGYQGPGDKTVIPAKASVKITCRLVANQDPEVIRKCVHTALKERCPKGVTLTIEDRQGAAAYLVVPPNKSNSPTPYSTGLRRSFEAAESAIKETFNCKPLYIREGGSIPIIRKIKEKTGLDSIMIGLSQNQDGMHSPNESFDLKMLEKGIKMYENIFKQLCLH